MLVIPGALCIAGYFIGYKRPESPAAATSRLRLSAGLFLFCFLRVRKRHPAVLERFGILALGYMAFVVLTAAMASVGRFDFATGFLFAKAGRYVTVPLIAWGLREALLLL